MQKKFRSGQTLRLTKKAQNEDLVVYLATLLSLDWKIESQKEEANAFVTQINELDDKEHPLRILNSRLHRENICRADPGGGSAIHPIHIDPLLSTPDPVSSIRYGSTGTPIYSRALSLDI